MTNDVREDDLSGSKVLALVAEHLAGMRGYTPPGQVHALAFEGLRAPGITFWSAWRRGLLCGCGAQKELDARTGEITSMRTRPACVRQGVGQAVLDRIVVSAEARGYHRLDVETGTGPAFDPEPAESSRARTASRSSSSLSTHARPSRTRAGLARSMASSHRGHRGTHRTRPGTRSPGTTASLDHRYQRQPYATPSRRIIASERPESQG